MSNQKDFNLQFDFFADEFGREMNRDWQADLPSDHSRVSVD